MNTKDESVESKQDSTLTATFSSLSEAIVEKRRTALPTLARMLEEIGKLRQSTKQLSELTARPPFQSAATTVARVLSQAQDLHDRTSLELNRCQSGLLTLAFVGLEKQGKSTILNTLLGREVLPVAEKRCTGAVCELIHESDETKQRCDIFLRDRGSVLHDLIGCMLKGLTKFKSMDKHRSDLDRGLELINALTAKGQSTITNDEFTNELKRWGVFAEKALSDSEQKGTPQLLLQKLKEFAASASSISALATGESKLNQPLEQIKQWVDETQEGSRWACVRLCRIYIQWASVPNIRFIDTPGVNDPNPYALETTSRILKNDTDAILYVTRPGNMPSVAGALGDFLNNMDEVRRTAIPTAEPMLFPNWDKLTDPDGKHIQAHIAELSGSFGWGNILSPINGRDDQTAVLHGLSTVVERLLQNLDHIDRTRALDRAGLWERIGLDIRNLEKELSPRLSNTGGPEQIAFDFVITESRRLFAQIKRNLASLEGDISKRPDVISLQEELKNCWETSKEDFSTTALKDVIADAVASGDMPAIKAMTDVLSPGMSGVIGDFRALDEKLQPVAYAIILEAISSSEPGGFSSILNKELSPKAQFETWVRMVRERTPSSVLLRNLRQCQEAIESMGVIKKEVVSSIVAICDPKSWGDGALKAKNALELLERESVGERSSSEPVAGTPTQSLPAAGPLSFNAEFPTMKDPVAKHQEFVMKLREIAFSALDSAFGSGSKLVAGAIVNCASEWRTRLFFGDGEDAFRSFLFSKRADIWSSRLNLQLKDGRTHEEASGCLVRIIEVWKRANDEKLQYR
jgi:hypothetical protein